MLSTKKALPSTIKCEHVGSRCASIAVAVIDRGKDEEMSPTRRTPAAPVAPPPSPAESLEWLLNFLRRDVGTLRPGELLDLRTDAVRFLLDANPAAIVPTDAPDSYKIALAKRKGERVAETNRRTITDDAVLVDLQTTLRASVG